MKRGVLFLYFFFLLAGNISAQKIDYAFVDKSVEDMPTDTTISVNDLVPQIIRSFKDDSLKTRALFDWISIHIRYDEDGNAALTENPDAYTLKRPAEVLRKRKGVCSEISILAKEMFLRAGLKCEVVDGKMEGYFGNGPVSHAWNAVELGGKWYLFDCTSAGAGKEYFKKINYFYFLPPPESLIATHWPDDAKWALLEKVPAQDEIDRFPSVWPDYFSYSDKPFPRNKEVVSTGGNLNVINYVMKGYVQEVRIVNKEDKYIPFRQTPVLNTFGDTTAYRISGLPKGNYTMTISGFWPDKSPGALTEVKRMLDFDLFVK